MNVESESCVAVTRNWIVFTEFKFKFESPERSSVRRPDALTVVDKSEEVPFTTASRVKESPGAFPATCRIASSDASRKDGGMAPMATLMT